jgi:hypothetical protein
VLTIIVANHSIEQYTRLAYRGVDPVIYQIPVGIYRNVRRSAQKMRRGRRSEHWLPGAATADIQKCGSVVCRLHKGHQFFVASLATFAWPTSVGRLATAKFGSGTQPATAVYWRFSLSQRRATLPLIPGVNGNCWADAL